MRLKLGCSEPALQTSASNSGPLLFDASPSTHGACQKKHLKYKPASLLIFMLQSKQQPFWLTRARTAEGARNPASKRFPPLLMKGYTLTGWQKRPCANSPLSCGRIEIYAAYQIKKSMSFPCCTTMLQESRSFICGNILLPSLLVRQGLHIYFNGFVA